MCTLVALEAAKLSGHRWTYAAVAPAFAATVVAVDAVTASLLRVFPPRPPSWRPRRQDAERAIATSSADSGAAAAPRRPDPSTAACPGSGFSRHIGNF